MSDPVLACENLTRSFRSVVAVDDLSLAVRDEFTSLIGPNGAGKTTTFDLLSGALAPTTGTIRFRGEEVTDLPPNERALRGLARTYQITNLFTDLTAFENVRLGVQAVSDVSYLSVHRDAYDHEGINERAHEVLDTIGFEENRLTTAANLSQGYKRLLEIAIALATDPELLMLDEPMAGLAVDKQDLVLDVVRDLADEFAVFLIEHKLDLVRDMSDRLIVMNNGRLLAEGTPNEVLADDAVQEAYLGGVR